ncbi:metal binding domain of Ada-domain-containing protein [Aspergillus multicolor]|uniref:putative DNA repair and transcription factor Ada n=1 Tax=Aspergillus multicolor TaxID=41759 RepID=UPI003CCD714C
MSYKLDPHIIPGLPDPVFPSSSTATRWQAVVTRDPTASFVYGVLTTKIYCRPSCAARLARRANVEFYDTSSQAQRAGFRACKRCKPEETLQAAVNPQAVLVRKACQMIEADIRSGVKPTLARLAGEAGLTPSHFHRVFKKIAGVTPGKYVAAAAIRAGKGTPTPLVEGIHSTSEDWDMDKFQPWDHMLCADLNAWSVGDLDWDCGSGTADDGGTVGADVGKALLWNEFDVLIAAEAEYASREEISGALGLSDSLNSTTSDSRSGAGEAPFAGI